MSNVFGTPITAADYPNKVDRATRAFETREADGKFVLAVNYVDGEKRKYGNGVSTLGLIYNATGDSVAIITSHDWFGRIHAPYPTIIQNGQWGAFLHTKRPVVASGSMAAVVYRARTEANQNCDIMLSWDNPWNKAAHSNRVYTRIREAGYFGPAVWSEIYDVIAQHRNVNSAESDGIFSSINIDNGTSPYLRAMLTLTTSMSLVEEEMSKFLVDEGISRSQVDDE